MARVVALIFFLALFTGINAQVLPREGSRLSYRLVGFSVKPGGKGERYKLEIAAGQIFSVDSFSKNVIRYTESDEAKIIGEVPLFGKQYTWRVSYLRGKKTVKTSPLYHFSTLSGKMTDTTALRLEILKPNAEFRDYYFGVDAGSVLYDNNGNPVWFLPDTNGLSSYVNDTRFTPQGTLTVLYAKDACEVTLNGDILWKAPNSGEISGDSLKGEIYHHEFTKLSNGHYMVLGMQLLMCKVVTTADSSYLVFFHGKLPADKASYDKLISEGYIRGRFGTLIEYDEQGRVVWSWKSSQYLSKSDFPWFQAPNINLRMDPHENTFVFDEKNSCIYLGYKNLNRIIKIQYPEGKVLAVYGDNFKPGGKSIGGGTFCNLHALNLSKEGYLYFFNNNSCRFSDSLPTVMLLQEPAPGSDTFKKIWEYTCTVPAGALKQYTSGGNAEEMNDQLFFVNMGSDYSKLFIVNREKQELWSALPERYVYTDRKWVPIKEFHANIVSRRDFEKMVWRAER